MSDEKTDDLGQTFVGHKDVYEALQSNEAHALHDMYAIESVMALIQQSQHEIDFLKKLKKRRTKTIEDKLNKLEDRVELLKNIVKETLRENREKTVDFPGVGKVTRRNKKANWEILNEEELIEKLKEVGEYENCVEEKPKVKKDEVKKILDQWEKSGELPDCVKRVPADESLTVSFDGEFDSNDKPSVEDLSVPNKKPVNEPQPVSQEKESQTSDLEQENLDSLDFTN